MNHLIPKSKFDIETAEKLNDYTIEELKPIIPQLLEWMQDANWPVFKPVSDYLSKHTLEIEEEILKIMQTDDYIWKYWILQYLGDGIQDKRLISEIKRIAINPSEAEIEESLNEIAEELIDKHNW